MYRGVPTVIPVWVMAAASVRGRPPPAAICESPKSATFTSPRGPTRMFAGLMSRWMMPASWAAFIAVADCFITCSASGSSSGPFRLTSCERFRPGTYSIAMYGSRRPANSSPPASPTV